jgi:phosphopantothenoylcysteine decarboxylase/phosphopantothenate--cysteine ligase
VRFGPGSGAQACGEIGAGRMLDVPELVAALAGLFSSGALQGARMVITAGPTYEAIDPVRFIGNRSSGRMGFALAEAARDAGAAVTLIAGPCALATPQRVTRIDVESAQQMFDAVTQQLARTDIFIGCAAVADYRPAQLATQKIKQHADNITLALVRNPDILIHVSSHTPRPFVVGFAAETENLTVNAQAKLTRKQLDMIVANDVSNRDIGFSSEDNALEVFWPGGQQSLPRARKTSLALQLMQLLAHRYRARASGRDSA